MRLIKFIKDFAGRVKGETILVDSMLASYLINKDKVAVKDEPKSKKSKSKSK